MKENSENINKAKKIFFTYIGSFFLMHHDGVEEEYRAFGISKVQESLWLEELKADLVSRLSAGDYSVLSKLWQMSALDVLPMILAIRPEGDSWTKLRFAEDLWDFAEVRSNNSAELVLIKQAREKAIEIWQVLLRTATDPIVPEKVMESAANGRSAYDYFQDRLQFNLKKASASGL